MAEPFPQVWERAVGIDGWLHRDEGELLHRLTAGPWCEVGCYKGRSTVILAATGHKGFAVDWFRGSPEMPPDTNTWREFSANLAPYDNVVTFRERYEDAADFVPSGLSLVHLDADHSYEATRRAFELYAPKVVRGGHVVFHDAWIVPWDQGVGWPGVTRFVTELGGQDEWEHVADADRSAAFQRR